MELPCWAYQQARWKPNTLEEAKVLEQNSTYQVDYEGFLIAFHEDLK